MKIRNQNQPLLKVQGDRRFNKSKDEKDKHYIYLVPEMVCLTGLTDEQRCNHHIMKSLGQYTKLTAQQRMMSATKMLGDIKKDKELIFEINDTPKALDGFTLKTPQVMLGPNKATRVDKGSMNFKERVLDPIEFKDFVIVYSLGKYPKDDQADVDEAFGLLKSAGQTFGIKFNVPIYLEVKSGGDIKNWISVLG